MVSKRIVRWLGGGVLALVIISMAASGGDKTNAGDEGAAPVASSQPTVATRPPVVSKPAGPSLTSQQKHAVNSARQYLSMQGFSRQGLIDQLASSAGDQYAVADATVAVDSLHVNWNEQAIRSAKAYLEFQSMSCRALIDQLASAAGEKFTRAQATYGAKHTNAC